MRARMNIGPIKPGKKDETIAFFKDTLSTLTPDTRLLLPSGSSVFGIELWVRKLGDSA